MALDGYDHNVKAKSAIVLNYAALWESMAGSRMGFLGSDADIIEDIDLCCSQDLPACKDDMGEEKHVAYEALCACVEHIVFYLDSLDVTPMCLRIACGDFERIYECMQIANRKVGNKFQADFMQLRRSDDTDGIPSLDTLEDKRLAGCPIIVNNRLACWE